MPADRTGTSRRRDNNGRYSNSRMSNASQTESQEQSPVSSSEVAVVREPSLLSRLHEEFGNIGGDMLKTRLLAIVAGLPYIWLGRYLSESRPVRIEHFRVASSLVQELTVDFLIDRQSDTTSTLQSLDSLARQTPLLPALRSLVLKIRQPEHLDGVRHLLHPGLLSLEVHCFAVTIGQPSEWEMRFTTLFEDLSSVWQTGHNLATLHLSQLPTMALAGMTIRPFTRLGTFKGDESTISPSIIAALGASPNFEKYELITLQSPSAATLNTCFQQTSFRSLTKLVLHCDSQTMRHVLHSVHSGLKELDILCRCSLFSTDSGRSFFHEHATYLPTLRRVSLEIVETSLAEIPDGVPRVPIQRPPMLWEAFHAFLQCSHMNSFSLITKQNSFKLTDNDLVMISRSWPEVQALSFQWKDDHHLRLPSQGHDNAPVLTMRAFPFLATGCPRLSSLALSWFDGRAAVPAWQAGHSSASYFKFLVGMAPIATSKPVAALLYKLWPGIDVVWPNENPTRTKWRSAMDHVAQFDWAKDLQENPEAYLNVEGDDVLTTVRTLRTRKLDLLGRPNPGIRPS